MCIALNLANFSQTKIGTYLVKNPKTKRYEIVQWYANTPEDLSGGSNAMLLLFNTKKGRGMTQKNFVDTTNMPRILADMERAYRGEMSFSKAPPLRSMSTDRVEVFDSGIYKVVLANSAKLIPNALNLVPAEKRPTLGAGLFRWLSKVYDPYQYSYALCCFNNQDSGESTPIMVHYEPATTTMLRAPGLDQHDGEAPNLGEWVDVDHLLFWAVEGMKGGVNVMYRDPIPENIKWMFPTKIVGQEIDGKLPQGDFVIGAGPLEEGKPFTMWRQWQPANVLLGASK